MNATTITKEEIADVQHSYGRCLMNGDVIDTFYNNFLSGSTEIAKKFADTDFEKQHRLLRHGINLMIMYADGQLAGESGLQRIKESHSQNKYDIDPHFYEQWKRSLIAAIAKHDHKFNDDLKEEWYHVLNTGIEYIKSGY